MNRAVVICADGEGGADTLAVDDDGGFGGIAGCDRFGIRVVGVFDLAEVSALDGTGAFFPGAAVAVLDLDKLGTCGKLAVDMGVDLGS